jgi:hypothetical protein
VANQTDRIPSDFGHWTDESAQAALVAYRTEQAKAHDWGKARRQKQVAEEVLIPLLSEAPYVVSRKRIKEECKRLGHSIHTANDARKALGIRYYYDSTSPDYDQSIYPTTAWSWLISPDGVTDGHRYWPVLPQPTLYGLDKKPIKKSKRRKPPSDPPKQDTATTIRLEVCLQAARSITWPGRNGARDLQAYMSLLRIALIEGMTFERSWEQLCDDMGFDGWHKLVAALDSLQDRSLVQWTNGTPQRFSKGHWEPTEPGRFTSITILPAEGSERCSADEVPVTGPSTRPLRSRRAGRSLLSAGGTGTSRGEP